MSLKRVVTAGVAALWMMSAVIGSAAPGISQVAAGFTEPPDDARVMMRWWWFGPAVIHSELQREIRAMKAGGFGGFEVQPVYPLSLNDSLSYLSNEFIAALRFAAEQARAENLRIDVTLGSGWPFGGPHVPITHAASQIRTTDNPVAGSGENLVGSATSPDGARPVYFMQSRTGQQVKRPGVGGEGYVLDHMNTAAVRNHLRVVGDRLMTAFGDQPPYAVFSDSLEVYRADWTDDLLKEFKSRRGYDLSKHLPALFSDTAPSSADIRHDWGLTLAELVDERYLTEVNQWAMARGTRFRSQTYGFPPVTLSSNALVALAEGEGRQWRGFSTTRWASSANHLYGRPVTSVEAWTWLHSPAFRATPLDMKAEADLHFLQGVNQLIGHGWPYTPPSVPAPGWAFYAAGVFSDQNPWWIAMPDISRYLQRVSFLLRQGEPVADVAILVATHDALAATRPGHASVTEEMSRFITPALTTQLLDRGYAFDYIDDAAVEKLDVPYRALILPRITRMAPATYRRIERFAREGGVVLAVGELPSRGPGFRNAEAERVEVQTISSALFTAATPEADVGAALLAKIQPDVQFSEPALGFVHRRLADADLYFVANTSAQPIRTTAKFRESKGRNAEQWNLMTGQRTTLGNGESPALDLAPYESRVIVFGQLAGAEPARPQERVVLADWSKNWTLSIESLKYHKRLKALAPWTQSKATKHFSGVGIYKRTVQVPQCFLASPQHSVLLNLGVGTPVTPDGKQRGSRAWLESPVREAAEVFVNGTRVGAIWAPPYEIDISSFLRPGTNHLELRVGNTAINALAALPPPDYRLLNERYGERFIPQDMDNLQPLPAGLTGAITLQGVARCSGSDSSTRTGAASRAAYDAR